MEAIYMAPQAAAAILVERVFRAISVIAKQKKNAAAIKQRHHAEKNNCTPNIHMLDIQLYLYFV